MKLLPWILLVHLSTGAGAQIVRPSAGPEAGAEAGAVVGPVVGHVGPHEARLWIRPDRAGPVVLRAWRVGAPEKLREVAGEAAPDSGLCVTLDLADLRPATVYRYSFHRGEESLAAGEDLRFRTAPEDDAAVACRLAFGSCANERAFPRLGIWDVIARERPDALVLLGDTPYIDTTVLPVQRRRHREFLSLPGLAPLLRSTPLYSTWDDHDYGLNDADGRLKGKATSRRAFVEHRPNPSHGEGGQGIYTSFRRGPVEVFLLDTRWFAGTLDPEDEAKPPTLLGKAQNAWLRRGLKTSTATFKLLACGMVWNGAVRPLKRDHWAHYPHERRALFDFLGREAISGVVLVSGDIHRTRIIRHATTGVVGYPLTELITSPLAGLPVPFSKRPHPGLLFDAGLGQTCLLVACDPQAGTLEARILDGGGKVRFRLALPARSLARKPR